MPIAAEHNISVPFYGQNWDVTNWRELGFNSKEDAQYWKESSCGILCFRMAADGLLERAGKEKTPEISELIRVGKEIGAYTHERGWIHKGLVELAEKYGLRAKTAGDLDAEKLRTFLDQGALVIVSIKWAFETDHSLKQKIRAGRDYGAGPLKILKLVLNWQKFGGHLALVVGYNKEGFFVHHPSTRDAYNWQGKLILKEQFMAGFTGRGIVIHSKS